MGHLPLPTPSDTPAIAAESDLPVAVAPVVLLPVVGELQVALVVALLVAGVSMLPAEMVPAFEVSPPPAAPAIAHEVPLVVLPAAV